MIVLDLPTPPSANALFANVSPNQRAVAKARGRNLRGRTRTPEYLSWIATAGWHIQIARQKPISGPVVLTYRVSDQGAFDLGNSEKAVSDLLVKHQLIEDDNRKIVRKIVLEWVADVEGCRVTVEPFVPVSV